MSSFTAIHRQQAVCEYRLVLVLVSFGHPHDDAQCYALYELSDRYRKSVAGGQMGMDMQMTAHCFSSSEKRQVLIPIASVPLSASVLHPAVSSPEASQTPAL